MKISIGKKQVDRLIGEDQIDRLIDEEQEDRLIGEDQVDRLTGRVIDGSGFGQAGMERGERDTLGLEEILERLVASLVEEGAERGVGTGVESRYDTEVQMRVVDKEASHSLHALTAQQGQVAGGRGVEEVVEEIGRVDSQRIERDGQIFHSIEVAFLEAYAFDRA